MPLSKPLSLVSTSESYFSIGDLSCASGVQLEIDDIPIINQSFSELLIKAEGEIPPTPNRETEKSTGINHPPTLIAEKVASTPRQKSVQVRFDSPNNRSQPQDSPEAKASPPTLTFSIRKKRSIRGHKDYAIVWYDSKAEGAVTADIFAGIRLSSPIRIGELVVHRYGDSGLQVFLCEEDPGALGMDNRRWTQIQSGHKHPFLRGHAFNMTPSGIPSWVRSETLTTYSGPKRQKRREETSN